MEKRSLPPGGSDPAEEVGPKKPRISSLFESGENGKHSTALTVADVKKQEQKNQDSTALVAAMRTSDLQAPIMRLVGHAEAIHSVKFSPNGNNIASGGFDKRVFLWKVYGDCDNYGVISGHKNCITEVQWSQDSDKILTSSADKTVGIWDCSTGARIRNLNEHRSIVNSVAGAANDENILVSASDDSTAKLWDPRQKSCTFSFDHDFQVFSARLSNTGSNLYTAGLDAVVRVWDVRKPLEPILALQGHSDMITGIDVDSSNDFVASIGMDNQVRVWDVAPFFQAGDENRCVKILSGSVQNFEKLLLRCSWSQDGRKVAAGSADGTACVWDVSSSELLYKLPGHKGPVREVVFHPNQPIIGSCSSDRTILIGEIE